MGLKPNGERWQLDRTGSRLQSQANDSAESLAFCLERKPVMAREVPIGAHGEVRETVEFKHTLAFHHAELPPVYSTPDMIRLMETAAFLALQPYCDEDEISVGTSINIQHRAASGIGAHVSAEATLESFDGRFYTLRVSARDHVQEIGRGTVGRAVVSVSKFLEKMKAQ
jgi:fluoroacetyl-CoA thioesterase